MKLAEKKNDKDFVNLHKTDRKRKFTDLQNSSLTLECKNENINSVFTQNLNQNQNQKPASLNTSMSTDSGRRILKVQTPKSLLTSNSTASTCFLSDEELEKLMNEVSVLTSKEDIKAYLRRKISSFISNCLILISLFYNK